MTIRSAREALDILAETRAAQLEQARIVAQELIRANGSTHGRAVRAEMKRRGIFDTSVPEHWLGALFQTSDFVWTGEYLNMPEVEERNNHAGKVVKVWRLRD